MTAVTTPVTRRYSGMDRESELDLVRRLRDGDAQAFDVVYETFNGRLFTFLARLMRSRARAEDLLEETWLRLVAHADRLHPDTRLGPWLFTVARNLHASYWRSLMLEEACADGPGLWPVASARSPFEETAANELERRVEAALAALPVSHREVLLLIAVEGLDQSEAANICGISATAFRQRLKRARDLLAKRLDESARPARGVLREVNP
ncbi:MAG TPA: RNA polymerase sigma factor [Vicinamibacterales bacterium]|nr:RNA polymerase sigma factor [Vicinamibacterales bacterium]